MQNKSKKIKQQKQPTKYFQKLLDMFKNASNEAKTDMVLGIIKTSFEKKITSYEMLKMLQSLFAETTIKNDTCGKKSRGNMPLASSLE